MFGASFKDKSLNSFGRAVADYLDRAGEAVLISNPVEGIPYVSDIEEDNSSYKQMLATTRLLFDYGVIWAIAYQFLRDEEYQNLNESAAIKKTNRHLSKFLKQGLKFVHKHDYDLPKIYSNHKLILNHASDAENSGEKSPFIKGTTFSRVFLGEFYGIKFND